MKVNDLYTGPERVNFMITAIELRENDPWVFYKNTQTNQEYSCRQEAFLSRFFPLPA